jgi:acyl dehydratase
MTSTGDTRVFPVITDRELAGLRSAIGLEVRRGQPYVEELTADAIRHYAHGIGDRNPLWVDPDYASASVHGGLMAPPTILFATDRVVSGYVTGLPGIHAMFAGVDFRYQRAPRLGDRIRARAVLTDVIERPGRFAGRSIQQVYEVRFYDQHGSLVASADSYCFRTERDTARERRKYRGEAPRWTQGQIDEIAQRYREQEERRRGPTVRHVEDVAVGDEVPEIIKGPYTATTAVAYLLGWGGLYVRAHGDAFGLYERHPALAIPNEWGVPEPPERVHWDPDMARRVGVPGAYDYGPERVSWLGHLVTDWMGDAGFLRRLHVQLRRHNLIGELVTCRGRVEAVDRGERVVVLALEARNQDGAESARGRAEVVLPTREGG